MFEVNDKVVYGIVGVCEVEDIAKPPIKGIDGKYYFLQPVYDEKGIIYSPVDSTKVPIRSIMTEAKCNDMLDLARTCKKDKELNEKIPAYLYDQMIKSQDPLQLIHLIRSLFNIKNERMKDLRKMKSLDSRMLNNARKLLYGELAIGLDQQFQDVEKEFDDLLSVI